MDTLDTGTLRRLPKVLLHDHLDGGLRPSTVLDLADDVGHALPADAPAALARWFHDAASSGDLEAYLATFQHTVGVMQTPAALARVTREAVEDLAADGVVYAELRFAPSLHTAGGHAVDDVVEAVTDAAGRAAADAGITVRLILSAMRTDADTAPTARLAARWRDKGVVGFDLAGAEAGHPADHHAEAVHIARRGGVHITLHAGEAAGPASVASALDVGAERLGHGIRVIVDVAGDDPATARLGPVASRVRDGGVLLEVCPTSNLDTGAARSLAEHPIERLRRLGFRISVNTDNRLMSQVSVTSELGACADAFGWDLPVLATVTEDAMAAAFCEDGERARLIRDVIRPAYGT